MKPHHIEISYTVQIWGVGGAYPQSRWLHYGGRKTIEGARQRRDELRLKHKRVRIVEHRSTATVVL